jgi:predicted  nucleic acid-binding Zn-ribbon protein
MSEENKGTEDKGSTKDIKSAVQHELERLAGLRDELRTTLTSAKETLEREWDRFEEQWSRLQGEFKQAAVNTKEPIQKLSTAATQLIDEVKRGFDRIKSQFKG